MIIKLSSITIKSPTKMGTCITELKNGIKSYNIGIGKGNGGKNILHAYGDIGNNHVVDFTNDFINERARFVQGKAFDGRLIERTNGDAKHFKDWFHEVYKFKTPESMKNFRTALKSFSEEL